MVNFQLFKIDILDDDLITAMKNRIDKKKGLLKHYYRVRTYNMTHKGFDKKNFGVFDMRYSKHYTIAEEENE
jgi:hypothetical protein